MRVSGAGKMSNMKGNRFDGRALVFLLCLVLIAVLAWGVRESRKAIRDLGFWPSSAEWVRRVGKYLYLFGLLLLIVRAFQGIWGVVKLLATVVMWGPLLLAEKVINLLNGNTSKASDPGATEEQAEHNIPVVGRVLFRLIEKRYREHAVGDLEEEYRTIVIFERDWLVARCWWWGQAFGLVTYCVWRKVTQVLGFEIVRAWRRR